jgi:hypothetical protein
VVLEVIGERPGVSARELAAASRVGGGTLYALLRTLAERGEIEKQQLPSGHTGYALTNPATTAAPSGAPETPRDSDDDKSAAPGARRREDDPDATPSAPNESAPAEAAAVQNGPDGAAETK